jgi:glycosyltransferase involved in cell wall biosynthesis
METARLLAEAGHEVHVIGTTRQEPSWVVPELYSAALTLHFVPDGKRKSPVDSPFRGSTNLLTLVRLIREIHMLTSSLKLDIFHVIGFERSARLAGILKLCRISPQVVLTILGPTAKRRWRFLYRRLPVTITSTEYVQKKSEGSFKEVIVLRHGVVRDLRNELAEEEHPEPLSPPRRVLFWREASEAGGADLVIKAYTRLAVLYPAISFDLALRPAACEVPGLETISAQYPNINIHRLPYGPGVTLAKLLHESICVTLPYRSLSIHPQLNIVESMAAGVATISTAIESTCELIVSGRNGLLIRPNDLEALIEAIETLLKDPETAQVLGDSAARDLGECWNWDHYISELTSIYERVLALRAHD